MRPIDADNVKSKLQQHRDLFVDACGGFPEMSPADKSRVDEIDNCIAEIVNATTIEATPVVHGRWEHYRTGCYFNVKCTACGVNAISVNTTFFGCLPTVSWNYCPNCCAKMDGGNHE